MAITATFNFRRYAAAFLLALLALSGCDEVNRSAFGGIKGHVGFPAISDCRVEIYNALAFEGLDSSAGLIATGRTNDAGKFSIEIKDKYLGRPLVIVARPGPDSMYRDFGAAGNPDVPFDQPRQPWVGVLNEWLGGEDVVSVNPMTTIAFHSLMRLPAEQVGPATLRFDRNTVNATFAATAANFGVNSHLAAENPAPPKGPMFEEPKFFFREENAKSVSYTYACLQLAKAANDFVAGTIDPTDSALDFYEALFRDAHDGVLDGNYFGTPETFLATGPGVVGRDTDGASLLLRWLATVPLDAAEEGYAGVANDGEFDPEPAVMLALQNDATGALRPTRIVRFDVRNYPFSGNVEMTIRGQGFRRSDRFVFRGSGGTKTDFKVDRNSIGVDGEFLYHSDDTLVMRIPDFATTTRDVDPGIEVPAGSDFRIITFLLENQPELDSTRRVSHVLTNDARVTNRSEPLLIHAEIGRVNALGDIEPSPAGNNVYPAATDPAALSPAADNVYEMRVRVTNPGADAIDNIGLSFGLSAITQLGMPVVPEEFTGAPSAGVAMIFESPLPVVATLAPGDVATLAYRFVFLDTAMGVELVPGAPVSFTPVLEGVSQGAGNPLVSTSDVIGFNRTVSLAPVDPAATPQLDALAPPSLPVSVTAGDTFEIRLDMASSPASGTDMRTLRVTDIALAITFDGESTEWHFRDSFFQTFGRADLFATSLVLDGGPGGLPVLLTQAVDSATLVLTVRTDAGRTGTLDASFTATAIDASTGVVSSQSSATANTSINP